MAGRELVLKRANRLFNLREESMKVKLRDVWNRGHPYVEIREEGKVFIFFCTLCLTKCFSDTVLDDHLLGNRHSKRRAFSDSTLFNDIPWPFNDGVLFCFNQPGKEKQLSHRRISYDNKMTSEFDASSNNGCLAMVANGYGRGSKSSGFDDDCDNLGIVESLNDCVVPLRSKSNLSLVADGNGNGETLIDVTDHNYRIIHGALIKERQSVLGIRLMGFGHISARLSKIDELGSKAGRIWCAWLGEGNSDDKAVLLGISVSDFAIVNFSYTYDLGRKDKIDDPSTFISSGSYLDIEEASSPRKLDSHGAGAARQRKKRIRPMVESTGSFSGDSSCENCSDSNSFSAHTKISCGPGNISTKDMRKELIKKKHSAAGKKCDICQQPMLPNRDVSTLLNLKTGKLACSSRNTNGAFHTFHISCLIHWVLVCELEVRNNNKVLNAKKTRGRKGKMALKEHISSILCPECQGTGLNIKGNQLEKPIIPLTEIFLCKMKAVRGHRSWKKEPEDLPNSSTGLHFSPGDQVQEKTLPNKLLQFYRVEY